MVISEKKTFKDLFPPLMKWNPGVSFLFDCLFEFIPDLFGGVRFAHIFLKIFCVVLLFVFM